MNVQKEYRHVIQRIIERLLYYLFTCTKKLFRHNFKLISLDYEILTHKENSIKF